MGNASTGPPARRTQQNARGGNNANTAKGGNNNTNQEDNQGYSTFSSKQRSGLQRRWEAQSVKGKGIPLDVCLALPEFVGSKLITILIHDYLDDDGNMQMSQYLQFCNFLSEHTSPTEKKRGSDF